MFSFSILKKNGAVTAFAAPSVLDGQEELFVFCAVRQYRVESRFRVGEAQTAPLIVTAALRIDRGANPRLIDQMSMAKGLPFK